MSKGISKNTIIFVAIIGFVALALALNFTRSDETITKGDDINKVKTPQAPQIAKNKFAVIDTNKGIVKFELYESKAPITTKNFINLTKSGFYTDLTFHRYDPGFVIQGGDPKGDGTGGSDKKIPLEIVPGLTHVKGAVAMARANDPNSASSQFYITLDEAHFLDGNYAVFGQVVEGMDVVLNLRPGDRMKSVTIVEK